MAVARRSINIASLKRKTLDQQTALSQERLCFKPKEIEKAVVNYVTKGIQAPYKEIVRTLKGVTYLSDENYKNVLEDSLTCVVLLDRNLNDYLHVLCNLEWTNRSDELVELYTRFLVNLVTAHTYHTPHVMSNLLSLFKDGSDNWQENPSEKTIAKWSKIHSIIAQIIAIMPLASDLLSEVIVEQFPYYKAGCYANQAYVNNLIRICKYIPSLTERIITVIINRLVILDASIIDQEKKSQAQQDTDLDLEEQNDLKNTLDYCMLEMLKWIEDERDPILNLLCNVFEKVILPTYGIRHIQFLLLYAISINQQCADRVLANLWKVAAGLHNYGPGALSTRRTAASHLSGLLARCVRVSNTRLVHYLKSMTDWCHSYITATQEPATGIDNVAHKVHGAFLAICHAVLYLVAFKHQYLFSSKKNIKFVESLNLGRLVNSTLNPLKTCPPQVTRAFSSVTRAHQVVYCQAIIENNTRHTIKKSVVQYDEWFPYDPYMLPVSGKMIWPLCIEYKDWSNESDDTQYKAMKRKLEVDDDDYLMPSPSQKRASSLSNCVSPGFRTSETIVA